jgi:ubiquinone/menaquinone biosynthesis C-methylase UbiE
VSLSQLTRRIRGAQRPARDDIRDDIVGAQYENPAAAAGYAAAYDGWGPSARYFRSRLYVVDEALSTCPGGRLLDVGCGPGMLVRHLLDTRVGDFHIIACDRSPAMIDAAAERSTGSDDVELTVALIEDMPFPDEHFDVVVAMGVLEYTDAGDALREIARVVRPGGLVVLTMLNPLSPYRLFEWCVYWPALRLLGRIERLLGNGRHGAPASGIRAVRSARLRRILRETGLSPEDTVHYDVTPLLPPLDRLVRRWRRGWRDHPERTVSRGALRWLGTAYLVTARRD